MFEKKTFVLKDVQILDLHTQEMANNGSRGQPESIAPEVLSWRQTEVKISPPKVAENCQLTRALLFINIRSGN